ncbi:MAG: hypothetical protein Q4B71_03700 [Cardiobacteriaceae bacterium]|nr:hypothetical protein [Cardiobacteriaceae bacterium]
MKPFAIYVLLAALLSACTWTYSPQPHTSSPSPQSSPKVSHVCSNGILLGVQKEGDDFKVWLDDGNLTQSALLTQTPQGFAHQRGLFQSPTLLITHPHHLELHYTDPYGKPTQLLCQPQKKQG